MSAAITPLRVALASSGLGRVLRGVEVWMTELTRHLPADLVEAHLWSGGPAPEGVKGAVSLGCISRDAVWLRWLSWHRRYQIEQQSFLPKVIRRLRVEQTQIVYCGDPVLAWHLKRFQSRHGARVVFMNGMRLSPGWAQAFDGVHLLTPEYREQAARELGEAVAERFFVAPHFVDPSVFHSPLEPERRAARKRFGLSEDAFVVLQVGPVGTVSEKRLDWVASEMAALDKRAVLFSVGADESGAAEVRTQVRAALGERATYAGAVARADMPLVYQAADVFALGALAEPFSISILEALASGLPVVHHINPTTCWITGKGGVAVSLTERGALGAALQELSQNQARRSELSALARQEVETRFTPQLVCRDIVTGWQQTLARPFVQPGGRA